jgi:1-pyrroline-5-carboxylate dehydrogenase
MFRNLAVKAPTIGTRVSSAKCSPSSFLLRTMSSSSKPVWATVDPASMGKNPEPYAVPNLVGGKWVNAKATISIPDPMDKNAQPIFTIPDTQLDELGPFFESLRKVTKSGMHNPLKNPERYLQYGEISRKVSSFFYSITR